MEERNKVKASEDEQIPENILDCRDPCVLSKFLRYFVLEVRKEDGSPYPPASIRSILSGLNRMLKDNGAPFSIMNKEDPLFRDLFLTLDSVTSGLHREGVGATKNSATAITYDHQRIFWEKKLLGYESPKSLQRAVFFGVGLNFVLRGVEEQHSLRLEQMKRVPDDQSFYSKDTYYEYTEFISKNNMHRFKDINNTNKCVRAYADPDAEDCLVRLLDFYIKKLPENPPGFYLRPLGNAPEDTKKPWYAKVRVGVNTLKGFLPEISEKAGIGVRYTNHSLRATAVTRMYENGVPEKIISEKSGHRSLKALRNYEHTSETQEKAAGESLRSKKVFSAVSEPDGDESRKDEVDDKKKPVNDVKQEEADPSRLLQQFSGLHGCVFNFYKS